MVQDDELVCFIIREHKTLKDPAAAAILGDKKPR